MDELVLTLAFSTALHYARLPVETRLWDAPQKTPYELFDTWAVRQAEALEDHLRFSLYTSNDEDVSVQLFISRDWLSHERGASHPRPRVAGENLIRIIVHF